MSIVDRAEHLYGDEPSCALCGHFGPDTDPQPCLSLGEAGHLVHLLRQALAHAQRMTQTERASRNVLLSERAELARSVEKLTTRTERAERELAEVLASKGIA